MKRIAITGARGFVGKNLVEYLENQYKIISITRRTVDLLDGEATRKFFLENNVDVIIHCANEGGSRKTGYDTKELGSVLTNNLKMFYNIEACMNDDMKMISFGSGAQYQKKQNLRKVRENSIGDFIPQDEYGLGKYIISKTISNNKKIYSPIIFGLYGKFEDYRFKFISNAIIKNMLKMPIVINQNVVFDYLYIDDFLKIIKLYIENDYANKQFNITPCESIDLLTIARLINKYSNFESEIIVRNQGLNYEYTANNSLMLENIGQFEFKSYEKGISDLYDYYDSNFNKLDLDTIINDEYIKYCKVNKNEKN